MSSPFTALTDRDWTSREILYELFQAMQERGGAIGSFTGYPFTDFVAIGTDIQSNSFLWARFYDGIKRLWTGDGSNLGRALYTSNIFSDPPSSTHTWETNRFWTLPTWADGPAVGAPVYRCFRDAPPSEGGTEAIRELAIGDIVGGWLVNDLRSAMSLFKCVHTMAGASSGVGSGLSLVTSFSLFPLLTGVNKRARIWSTPSVTEPISWTLEYETAPSMSDDLLFDNTANFYTAIIEYDFTNANP